MTPYDPNIHHLRSIRLKGYDYAREGLYFITLCVQNREHLFGEIKSGKMILNAYGQIAHEEWKNTGNIRDNVAMHEFIVMPDHFHAIIEILFHKGKEGEIGKFRSPSQTIGAIIRGYKIATIKKIKEAILKARKEESIKEDSNSNSVTGELQFAPTSPIEIIRNLDFKIWQRNYYENIIRNKQAYLNISKYIVNNPKKKEKGELQFAPIK